MDILLGGLVSALTLAIVKAFEIWQKSKEHNYSMQTAYFERKLEAAETAMMGFKNELSYYEKYVAINELFENAQVEKIPFLLSKLQEISDEYSESIQNIEHSIIKIYFYFDLEEDIYFNTNYKKLIKLIGEIKDLTDEIGIQASFLKSTNGNKKMEDTIIKSISEKAKGYVPIFKEINQLITKAQEELFKNMNIIKKEMSKYNPK